MKGKQSLVVMDAVCRSGMGMGWASPGASDRILASEEHGSKETPVMMACASVCGRSGGVWGIVELGVGFCSCGGGPQETGLSRVSPALSWW